MEGCSSFESLPIELLTYIHLWSLSSALPNASKTFQSIFAQSSNHHKALYLKFRHLNLNSPSKLLSKSLKYGICTLPVLKRIEEIVLKELGEKKGKEFLKVEELPKRLIKYFKNSTPSTSASPPSTPPIPITSQIDLPYIHYLLSHYSASPNSQKGYWLAKAVVENELNLIKMLLRFGADPSLKEGYAVVLAIGSKDLKLVKLLLEVGGEVEDDRDEISIFEIAVEGEDDDLEREVMGEKRKRRISGSAEKVKVKKRKLGETNERCPATPAMLEVAARLKEWNIFKYLVSRGAKPNMEVIRLMDDI